MVKKILFSTFLMLGLFGIQLSAQEVGDAAKEEITEEELMKYAVMEESTAAFLQEKQDNLVEMIKTDEALGGAARYNEIKGAWGDAEKLAAINITEEETAAFQKIQDFVDSLGKEVVKYKTEIIMDAELLGAATYNKVKKAMDADPSVKEKIDTLIADLKEKRKSGDGDVTE
ncbi:hypothetical protein P872_04955 [Rhodonellum psychrophilum GCM71 = DSM 17998]|uniref:DUF4168 domain-containing protein n=2 Tax=Rhodonellum TaxID=336827 RepID=U5BQV6_9BACT|nr:MULTISPECIES: hypothetical protein [Rhodonellum]ERM82965.1 hypothetical protein P872_04955 [Rhodonellum psychrophilum GCM71 = DSM 17998]MDO9553032.1 hypothetical protein [Rhodonellum sp.]SDZ36501.1 hypothetical protein SAMN05444412_111112 [Rhodonellum ikkaensis]